MTEYSLSIALGSIKLAALSQYNYSFKIYEFLEFFLQKFSEWKNFMAISNIYLLLHSWLSWKSIPEIAENSTL